MSNRDDQYDDVPDAIGLVVERGLNSTPSAPSPIVPADHLSYCSVKEYACCLAYWLGEDTYRCYAGSA